MQTPVILIVGAVAGNIEPVETIAQTLGVEEERLQHGAAFTGKPATRLYASATHVVKVNTSGGFDNSKIAVAWCCKYLLKSTNASIYPPKKTWFVLQDEGVWRAGNIAERLSPLHTVIANVSSEQALEWLLDVSEMYLRHAAQFQERLDEGLSNFGVAPDGHIYYLDDDFYTWDHFLSFVAMLAGWLRHYAATWFENDLAVRFGQHLGTILHHHFDDVPGVAAVNLVYEHLGSQYLTGAALERAQTIRHELLWPSQRVEIERNKTSSKVTLSEEPLPVREVDLLEQWFAEDEAVALLADIHANLPALQQVLAHLDREGIDRIVCLGDLVGYGPHPAECIDLACERGFICLRGNHDHMVGTSMPVPSMHGNRLVAAQWTIERLDARRRQWLASLPLQWRQTPWLLVHGSPQDPTFFNAYVYDRTADQNLAWMAEQTFSFCLHGHSHLQGSFISRNGDTVRDMSQRQGAMSDITLFCPGSVGQPRGGFVGAEFAILRPASRRFELHRIDYDLATTIADMEKFELPASLIQRLKLGN